MNRHRSGELCVGVIASRRRLEPCPILCPPGPQGPPGPPGPPGKGLCSCCVQPMQKVLSQLTIEQGVRSVRLSLTDFDGPFDLTGVQLVRAREDECVVLAQKNCEALVIPTWAIAAVAAPEIGQRGLELCKVDKSCRCDCVETPIRFFFEQGLGGSGIVDLDTLGGGWARHLDRVQILRTGKGIMVVALPDSPGEFAALSLCKIVLASRLH